MLTWTLPPVLSRWISAHSLGKPWVLPVGEAAGQQVDQFRPLLKGPLQGRDRIRPKLDPVVLLDPPITFAQGLAFHPGSGGQKGSGTEGLHTGLVEEEDVERLRGLQAR